MADQAQLPAYNLVQVKGEAQEHGQAIQDEPHPPRDTRRAGREGHTHLLVSAGHAAGLLRRAGELRPDFVPPFPSSTKLGYDFQALLDLWPMTRTACARDLIKTYDEGSAKLTV